MKIAIEVLETELKKLDTILKSERLMKTDVQRASNVMANVAQIKKAIKLLKAKQLISVRNTINKI